MDGTLIDSGSAITNAINHVRGHLDMPPLAKDITLEAMNDPDIHSPSFFYNVDTFTQKQIQLFEEYYDVNCTKDLELYDGIYDLLELLYKNGVKLSVATNAHEYHTKKMLKASGIDKFLDLVVAADMVQNPKPSPDMILYTLEKTAIDAQNSLLIGDSLKDRYAANNAGIDSTLVDWGFSNHGKNAINDIKILERKLLDFI